MSSNYLYIIEFIVFQRERYDSVLPANGLTVGFCQKILDGCLVELQEQTAYRKIPDLTL